VNAGSYAAAPCTLVHAVRGRIRIRIDEGHAARLSDAAVLLSATPGVINVRSNPACRSIVVCFDERLSAAALLASASGIVAMHAGESPAVPRVTRERDRWVRLAETIMFELADIPVIGLVREALVALRIVRTALRERSERPWPHVLLRAAVALIRDCSLLDVFLPRPLRWVLRLARAASAAFTFFAAEMGSEHGMASLGVIRTAPALLAA
jgi:hypothetical protein